MIRFLTLLYGILFLVVGIAGFDSSTRDPGSDRLFGLFPVNDAHNALHFAVGVTGLISASFGVGACRAFARAVGVLYIVAGLLGIARPDGFGIMPLGGADIPLHLGAGAIALYLGFARRFARQEALLVDSLAGVPRRAQPHPHRFRG